jgi:hypothetical protein
MSERIACSRACQFCGKTTSIILTRKGVEQIANRLGLNQETHLQTYLGDIKGVAVYKCGKCGKQNYGKGLFCRNCGCKLKESDNGRSD